MHRYVDLRMETLQSRFREVRQMLDAATRPVRHFEPNHRSEMYKAALKSLVLADSILVGMTLQLAQDRYPAGDVLVYPMLHLAGDLNERGNWHRDGNETNRQVFWIPMTVYRYPGLSVIEWSAGMLSKSLAFIGSRFLNLDLFAQKVDIAPKTYLSWSPRMIHRGNLNMSDDLSAAMVIFLDQSAQSSQRRLGKLEADAVKRWLTIVDGAIELDKAGNIVRVDQERLRSLDEPFQSNFVSYFQLRTKIDLLNTDTAVISAAA
jgi:hypothetical protein